MALHPSSLKHLKGFIPLIINILPAEYLLFLLGLDTKNSQNTPSDTGQQTPALTPAVVLGKES